MLFLVLSCKLSVKRGWIWMNRCATSFVGLAYGAFEPSGGPSVSSTSSTVYPLYQAGQHATNFVQGVVESFVLFVRQQSEVAREQQKILQLARRAGRVVQKLTKLGLAATTATLRDVCRDRSRSSPHLACDAVPLGVWERARRHVNAQDERMALLPGPKLLKILHRASRTSDSSVYLQLNTNNCQLTTGAPW
jgi:hypothetical protein